MYDWVNEGSVRKYHRALAQLTKEGKEVTEEAVKALYVKAGGLVLGDSSTALGVPGGTEQDAVVRAEEANVEKGTTKRVRKPKAE